MTAKQIIEGGRYLAKVSGHLTVVRVVKIVRRPDYRGNLRTAYQCCNERTGREIWGRSPQRFRAPA